MSRQVDLGAQRNEAGVDGPYAWYALTILVFVYALNFIDRQIISILAEDIKADLLLTDTQLGFLYGTAFAIFYALFGIPLGRLADSWHRGRLIGLGLVLWSSMTALSGFAGNFAQLAIARVGVGIGEAAASPAAYSMLADFFSGRRRAFAISIYSTGLYLGLGLSLPLGGWIADSWNQAYSTGTAPLGLAGWQAAFLAVGFPGLLMAAWVFTIREPMRGASDGIPTNPVTPGAWRRFALDLAAIVPPLTLWSVARFPGALRTNLVALAGIILTGILLILVTGDITQWVGYGVGCYSVFSWIQMLRNTDGPTFELIWGSGTVRLAFVAFGLLGLLTYGYTFWVAPYSLRTFGVSKEVVGLYIGIPSAVASAIGVVFGGRLSDHWKSRDARGRVFVCMLAVILPAPFAVIMFAISDFTVFCILSAIVYLFNSLYLASAIAAYQDLVLPRMRGTIGATFVLGSSMLGLALGPYFVGKVATVTGSLQTGMYSLFAVGPLALVLLWLLSKRIGGTEASKFDRARAAGEPSSLQSSHESLPC